MTSHFPPKNSPRLWLRPVWFHCIDIWPRDILFVATASKVVSGQLGRCSASSNFGVYGSSIRIFPQRWKNSATAPTHKIKTRITISASSGRTTILFPVSEKNWWNSKSRSSHKSHCEWCVYIRDNLFFLWEALCLFICL